MSLSFPKGAAMFKSLRFKIAWLRWFLESPFRLGDPLLGSGETRKANIKMILERHYAREPKREDYA
jgi:hypothetical protein